MINLNKDRQEGPRRQNQPSITSEGLPPRVVLDYELLQPYKAIQQPLIEALPSIVKHADNKAWHAVQLCENAAHFISREHDRQLLRPRRRESSVIEMLPQ